MTSEKINKFTEKFGKNVSKEQLTELEDKLEDAQEEVFERLEQTKVKSSFVTVMLSAILGLFGAGSFYVGRIKAGVLKVVFNVVVPFVVAMVFLVWLAPAYASNDVLSQCLTWIPATYLMADGVIIISWWIAEVFKDREKCFKLNYESLKKSIEK